MIVLRDFLDSLKPDDLVAATVASSSKLHLVRVVRRVTADMVKGQPDANQLATLFDCRPLCEVRPRYYWRPTDQLETWAAESKCRWCFSKWRAAKRPLVKGWAKAEAPIASSIRLPWGWHEVTPSRHPLDLAESDPDPDPDDEEQKVGSKRTEVRRWLRGNRYVRITHELRDQRFAVRYGALDDDADDENWNVKCGWDKALLRAVTLMALGGSPAHRTRYDLLGGV